MRYLMRQKMFSLRDNYNIQDDDRNDVFQVKG